MKVVWTKKNPDVGGYYFFSGYNGLTIGILYLEKDQEMASGDVRSKEPIALPDKPK
jgi:hypothetical protein